MKSLFRNKLSFAVFLIISAPFIWLGRSFYVLKIATMDHTRAWPMLFQRLNTWRLNTLIVLFKVRVMLRQWFSGLGKNKSERLTDFLGESIGFGIFLYGLRKA